MNDLKIFTSAEFGQVRTSYLDGEPMFCLTDICRSLDLSQPSKVKERLNEKGVNTIPTLTQGGTQNLLYVNESNLYKVIFQSRKESAERFTEWVTSKVLPDIRKTGTYQKPLTQEEIMRVQLSMIDNVADRVDKLENTMVIDYGQQQALKKLVNAVVVKWLGGMNTPAYKEIGKKVFSECNRDIQDRFNVNSRNNVPRLKYEEVCEYIKAWEPCINTKMLVNDCNAQYAFAGV
ncbi:ORF6C domain-containing protein [Anaerosporobacter sp.]